MAGLHLVTGDAPAALLAHLDEHLRDRPLSPFDDETIIVQSLGMERWVRQQLAKRRGCAASLAMPFPAGFCRSLAEALQRDAAFAGHRPQPLDTRFEEAALTWRLYAALGDPALLAHAACGPLRAYLQDADERKRFGLARSITARFDEYRLYRPDVMLAWEDGRLTTTSPAEAWQAALWAHLLRGERPMHFARWFTDTIARLEQTEVAPAGLPPRVVVFGVSTLPPVFVRLLKAVARFVSVHVAVLSPGVDSWREHRTRHPLTARFAAASRELLQDLAAPTPGVPIDLQHTHVSVLDTARAPDQTVSLLHQLQHALRAGLHETLPTRLTPGDRSLTVQDCHSPLRELEVLRDQLLDAFAADPTLRPHDVLIMVPDVETYAPLAEAIFANEHDGLARIPFRVADRALSREVAPARALREWLDLVTARGTASELLNLLFIPPVRRAAAVSGAQLDRIAGWVRQAGIRWGEDGAARAAEYDLPAVNDHTWQQGLDRLLVGYAVGNVAEVLDGVRPVGGDTSGDTVLLGNFVEWVEQVFAWRHRCRTVQSLREWSDTLQALLSWLVKPDSDDERQALDELRRSMTTLSEAAQHVGDLPVPFEIVREWLRAGLEDGEQASGFLTGGMTLCAMKPMRAVPHRIIAMLGLSDDAFPRRQRRTAFDLIALEPRRGDREVRVDDRQLLLDTLLCAEDRLLLSYVGRSQVDNGELAPSIVVAELLDYLDATVQVVEPSPDDRAQASVPSRSMSQSSGTARARLHVQHHLQPFSPAYFAASANHHEALFTFDASMARGVHAAQHRGELATPFLHPLPVVPPLERDPQRAPEPWLRVSVEDLVDAWTQPARWYCRRVLQMDVRRGADRVDDVEPLTVDPLLRTRMQQQFLQRTLHGQLVDEAFLDFVLAGGELPPAALGASWVQRLHHDIQPLLGRLRAAERQPPMTVDITGADWQVQGTLDLQVDGGQWCVRAAKLKARDHLQAWVLHVLRAAAAEGGVTWLYGTDGAVKLSPLSAAQAHRRLDALVQGFRIMSRMPVPFFPQSAWAYREMQRKAGVDQARLLRDFEATGEYAIGADGGDDYVKALWRGLRPLDQLWTEFSAWCDVFWQDHEVTPA